MGIEARTDGSYRSTGLTSRGRIGIDAALTARALVNPWFTDEIDREVLLQGLQEIVSTMPQGEWELIGNASVGEADGKQSAG